MVRCSIRGVRRAYTLVELLIVVAILGLMAGLIGPSMRSTGVLRVQAAVRTLVADITEAQSEALAFQRGRAIVFYPDENRWRIVEINGPVLDPDLDMIRETKMEQGGDFGDSKLVSADFDGDTVLVFDEMGGPVTTPGGNTPSSNGVIRVTGSEQVFEVTVEAYTGRVRVKRISG